MKYDITEKTEGASFFSDEDSARTIQENLSETHHNNYFSISDYKNGYVIDVMDEDFNLLGNIVTNT